MTYDGAGSIYALGLRLTKLDPAGQPLPGPRNCYTTDALVTINPGLAYSEPDAVELLNGKGQTCIFYQPPPTVRSGTLEEFRVCTPDPNILDFLIGATVITAGGSDEVQTVTITGGPTGGTFTLTFDGQTTAGIAYNATAATVRSALEALSNINPGDVAVTGTSSGPWTVTFGGQYAETDVPTMTASATGLTGGTAPAVNVAVTTEGEPGDATIGAQAPAVNVDATPNGVAIEAWSNALRNNAFDSTLPYFHWVMPRARVRMSETMSLGAEDPATPQFEGETQENPGFGTGPAADIEFPTSRVWQFCRVATMPDLSQGFYVVS